MNIFSKPAPALTPEDLGIDLEEDSTDVTDEEVSAAVDTDGLQDLSAKIQHFLGGQAPASFELRRKAGILYSRVTLGSGQRRLFNIEWIRKGLTNE